MGRTLSHLELGGATLIEKNDLRFLIFLLEPIHLIAFVFSFPKDFDRKIVSR